MTMRIGVAAALAGMLGLAGLFPAAAAEIKVLSAGPFIPVAQALSAEFEKSTGNKVVVDTGTAGALTKRISSGEKFDVLVVTPAAIKTLFAAGKTAAGTGVDVAGVGIGVMVKEGAPKPDVSTVEAFKKALLAAKSVAYIDPKSGGSSGIYIDKLLEKLGIADQVRAKVKLKIGGHVADLVVSGEAELGLHQISEIVPVKGVTVVGPFPKEIQNTTIYAAVMSASTKDKDAAAALIKLFSGPKAEAMFKSTGLQSPK